MKGIEKKLKNNNIEIPKIYLDYLVSDNFDSELTIFEDEDEFNLYTLEDLCKELIIDGEKVLQVQELKGYIKTILEVNEDFFDEEEKKEYEELSKCLAIGCRNTDVLFIDKQDNNTLYIFHPDGGDTEKIKNIKLENIVKR
ncbi:MAG: hypothetical protein KGV59_02455 [Tenacibaculum sp.]|nr:hypothetical protein [Tenacibaculum sp.]